MCGISDVADGYLARRFRLETRLGEQLDSLGDAAFCGTVFYLLIVYTNIIEISWASFGIVVVTILRIINFIITKVRFKTWGIMHTWGNKTAGILLYLYVSVVLIFNMVLLIPGIVLCFISVASSIEEMAILLTFKEYDANRKSIFIRNDEEQKSKAE